MGKRHRWMTSGEISREVKKGTDGAFYENGNLERPTRPACVDSTTVGKGHKSLPSVDQTLALLHPNSCVSFVFVNALRPTASVLGPPGESSARQN